MTKAVVALLVSLPATLLAQSAQDKATASGLFEEGKRLLGEGKIAEACPKFEAAQHIAPTLGHKLNLADCYRQAGRTASAWVEFREAAAQAGREGDDRESFARERAADLEKSLSRLTIRLSSGADVPGLVVKRDGTAVERAQLGTGTPIDPGLHVIEASAPKKTAWSSQVEIGPAASITVDVPVLGEPTRYPEAPVRKPVPVAPVVKPPTPAPLSAPVADEGADPGSTRRYLGLGVAGVGVVGLVVGTVEALHAKSLWSDAKNESCDDSGKCTTQAGVDMTNSARSAGTLATVAIGVGAAAVAGGLILYFTAPHAEEKSASVQVVPSLASDGFAITLRGAL
jgi:hypothetical protein